MSRAEPGVLRSAPVTLKNCHANLKFDERHTAAVSSSSENAGGAGVSQVVCRRLKFDSAHAFLQRKFMPFVDMARPSQAPPRRCREAGRQELGE